MQYLDGDLELSTRFSSGEPASGAVVRLLNPDGTPGVELGRTDADGQVKLDLQAIEDGRYDLQVDGGPGTGTIWTSRSSRDACDWMRSCRPLSR